MSKLIQYFIATFLVFMTIVPFAWAIYASFIAHDVALNVFPVPKGALGLENYRFILTQGSIGHWYLNSIVVTGSITLANLLINSMAGYALARTKMPGGRVMFFITLGLMMVPAQVLYIPVYIIVIHLGWMNSYWALIVPFLANPFGIFLMHQFFKVFPRELEEAAVVDGLSTPGIFFRIALPLAGPAVIAQAIFLFVWNWNNFPFPSIVEASPTMYTLPVAIYQMTHTTYSDEIAKSMAGIVLSMIPVIIIYFILQRRFVEGISQTGIKG